MFYVLMAFVGDCGTPYPGWWWQWWKNPPPPPPWWFLIDLVAAGGGILGGVMAQQLMLGTPTPEPASFLTSFVAAFAVGRVAGALATRVLSGIGATANTPALAGQAA